MASRMSKTRASSRTARQIDSDGDGVFDAVDPCLFNDGSNADGDGDGIPNLCRRARPRRRPDRRDGFYGKDGFYSFFGLSVLERDDMPPLP